MDPTCVLQYIFPCLVVAIAVTLMCFFVRMRKRRAEYDVTVPPRDSSSVWAIATSEREEEEGGGRDPPRYSTVGPPPPPYSLFDLKGRTTPWPSGPPPGYGT